MKGLARLFCWELSLIWIPIRPLRSPRFPQQLDRTLPVSRPPSSTPHGHQCLTLTRSTRPLSPSPRPSVRASALFTSLAGRWFGFAVPMLSHGGASVVAEENRYPFYVFIISQIKKPKN